MKSFTVGPDKSISHRAIMFGTISKGKTIIKNILLGKDCLSTIECCRSLGAEIKINGTTCIVKSNGFENLKEPKNFLNSGNSGTTVRLLSGILASCKFNSFISGDSSLNSRPMKRIIEPLSQMNAEIISKTDNTLPICIKGTELKAITYKQKIASAQVKSCILLAGLFTEGRTIVIEPEFSRDHTELMIPEFGGKIIKNNKIIEIKGKQNLKATEINVPGDISSAAFLIAASLITKKEIKIKNIGLNPLRTGCIEVFRKMGAKIEIENMTKVSNELRGDIIVLNSELKGIEISGDIIPRVIDEIPIIAAVSTFAKGITIIKDALELRKKECDRIKTIVNEFLKLGIKIEEKDDGFIIKKSDINKKNCDILIYTKNDHRIAMTMSILGLCYNRKIKLDNKECVNISFPGFFEKIEEFRKY